MLTRVIPVCCLFKALVTQEYIASNYLLMANNEVGIMWSWHNLRCYAGICLKGLKTTTKDRVRIADVAAKIRIFHLWNICHNPCRFS
jgi:hypothetical protein